MTITARHTDADLALPRNAEIAVAMLRGQGRHGTVSKVAREFDVSRGRVYRAAQVASRALTAAFAPPAESTGLGEVPVGVDEAQVKRFIVAGRVEGVNSIRALMRMAEHAFGFVPSYRYVRETLEEAYVRAAAFNASVPLNGIQEAATDEMFSQGSPVLGGIDLRSQYTFLLRLRGSRDETAWSEELEKVMQRGFKPGVVVKDAGKAMASAISKQLPDCEQRDDCFHAAYRWSRYHDRLERRALGAIGKLYEVREAYRSGRYRGSPERQLALLGDAELKCQEEIARFDHFAAACEKAREAMEFCDLETGRLRGGADIAEGVRAAAAAMRELDDGRIDRDVATYLEGRAEGLGLYAERLRQKLTAAAPQLGGEEVVALCCMFWRRLKRYRQARWSWERREHVQILVALLQALRIRRGDETDAALDAVFAIIDERYRASSLIESLNSLLRPYLFVHKDVSQGFLDLFTAWRNLRTTTWWGKHKGKSPYEVLTGERVEDWLTKLGYPPRTRLQ
jgi:hypothetical protein